MGNKGTRIMCPVCGNRMLLRVARRGKNAGSMFMGCSNFPHCGVILAKICDRCKIPMKPLYNPDRPKWRKDYWECPVCKSDKVFWDDGEYVIIQRDYIPIQRKANDISTSYNSFYDTQLEEDPEAAFMAEFGDDFDALDPDIQETWQEVYDEWTRNPPC